MSTSNRPGTTSCPALLADEEFDLEKVIAQQDRYVDAGCADVLDLAQEVFETGEGREVPLDLLPRARNKTKVFCPQDLDYILRSIGASLEQHGLGDQRPPTAALVPLGQAFVDADAVAVHHLEAPLTRECAEAVATMLDEPAGAERGVLEVVRALCDDPTSYGEVMSTMGWHTAGADRISMRSEAVAARPVATHTVAGLASREKMWVERDAVVTMEFGCTSSLKVVEAKSRDPRLFSTQQLGRGYHATLADPRRGAAAGDVECWQVHLADRTDPGAATLRLYKIEFDGPDTVFDRRITATYQLHLG
jgi:hypothetical protein